MRVPFVLLYGFYQKYPIFDYAHDPYRRSRPQLAPGGHGFELVGNAPHIKVHFAKSIAVRRYGIQNTARAFQEVSGVDRPGARS